MSQTLSRRELLARGTLAGAALALPLPEAASAVRRRQPRESVHCLPPADRFTPGGVLPDASFAAFSPDGRRIAAQTPRGIEIYDRDARTRAAVTRPGFTLAADAWHPSGDVLIASGPAEDGSGPFLHAVRAGGTTRLLPDHPGQARAACFSPDGRKVAFTYTNQFVHQLCMADWGPGGLVAPVNLFPEHPQQDGRLATVMSSLAWYGTRGFSADGTRLYFASDRRAGMLNVGVHYVELAKGTRHRVTYDEGVAEGAVLSPDGRALYSATTRAREPAFMTMFSGPAVPAFLGFAAQPTLHEQLAAKKLAVVSNGDVIAVDPDYGLRGRIVGSRRPLARKANPSGPGGLFRLIACSMSPDGRDLATAMISAAGSSIVLLRRSARAVPPPVPAQATPVPPGAAPLAATPIGPVERTIESRRGGRVTLRLQGDLAAGDFQMTFENFSADGVHVFGGDASIRTRGGGFRHVADVRRVNLESQEDVRVFYSADMQVDWVEPDAVDGQPATGGTVASLSRSGDLDAAWNGSQFAPQRRWNAGNRGPRPVPGAKRCPTRR